MTTYRVGRHQPQNVYRDDQYIGVMFTAEDAQLTVEALNASDGPKPLRAADEFALLDPAEHAAFRAAWLARAAKLRAPLCTAHDPEQVRAEYLEDSCTCTKVGPDADCIVHQGRRARGPKPAPLGPGCICDGSGRTCPRHGAVI